MAYGTENNAKGNSTKKGGQRMQGIAPYDPITQNANGYSMGVRNLAKQSLVNQGKSDVAQYVDMAAGMPGEPIKKQDKVQSAASIKPQIDDTAIKLKAESEEGEIAKPKNIGVGLSVAEAQKQLEAEAQKQSPRMAKQGVEPDAMPLPNKDESSRVVPVVNTDKARIGKDSVEPDKIVEKNKADKGGGSTKEVSTPLSPSDYTFTKRELSKKAKELDRDDEALGEKQMEASARMLGSDISPAADAALKEPSDVEISGEKRERKAPQDYPRYNTQDTVAQPVSADETLTSHGGNERPGKTFTPDEMVTKSNADKKANGAAQIQTPGSMNAFGNNAVRGKYERSKLDSRLGDIMDAETKKAPAFDSSLRTALQNGVKKPPFKADGTKKDGGFFGWAKSVFNKMKPKGMRPGETEEEYDRRITNNRKMLAVLADSIRHMGNIINTSKGAPLQQFNNPAAEMEAAYQKRKAERKADAKAAADANYKASTLALKQSQAEAAKAYRDFKTQLEKDKFDYQKDKDKAAAEAAKDKADWQKEKDERDFNHKKDREKVADDHWKKGYGVKLAQLGLQRQKFAHQLAKDGGATKGYNYATPYGMLKSDKKLSTHQEDELWNFMVGNGQITPQKKAEFDLAFNGGVDSMGGEIKPNMTKARQIVQKAIAYGLQDATSKGDKMREYMQSHMGMSEYRTTSTPQGYTIAKKGAVKKGARGKLKI